MPPQSYSTDGNVIEGCFDEYAFVIGKYLENHMNVINGTNLSKDTPITQQFIYDAL